MPVMELTVEGSYYEQKFVNRWNYVGSGTPSAVTFSFALLSALGFTSFPVDPALGVDFFSRYRQVVNDQVKFSLATARDIHSDTDFWSISIAGTNGLQAGDPSATFLSFGFRTNQVKKSVRPGQKRLVGVTDEDMESGGAFAAGATGRMDNFAIEMSEVQNYDDSGQVLTFKPAVCAKMQYDTPSGGKAYKYYPSEAEQLAHTAESVVWKKKGNVRSQVSRQRGRGA